MKKTNKILLIALIASVVIATIVVVLFKTIWKPKYPGFEMTKNGIYYKPFKDNDKAEKPKIGDFLICDYTIKYNDTTVFTTIGNDPEMKIIPLDSNKTGYLFEGLKLLKVGDSTTFIISIDSMRSHNMGIPESFKSGTVIFYNLKVISYKTKEAFLKEQNDKRNAYLKKMEEAKAKEVTDIEKYIADNKIKVKPTESGLYYVELKKGNGAKVETGKKVKINYIIKFINGDTLSTNMKSKKYEPSEFEIGGKILFTGWEEGLCMMKVGGKAKLIIPSKIAFGVDGDRRSNIPPYMPIIVEVELISVEK